MNGNKSEPLTRDESEGDRCRRDTSDLQRMCASHSGIATGGDKPVGASRSESAKKKKKGGKKIPGFYPFDPLELCNIQFFSLSFEVLSVLEELHFWKRACVF